MLTELQKKTCQAIVNIFETSKAQGEYGKVTLIPGDSGHLTYGRSQTTLCSGNLYLLIKDYCQTPDASFAVELEVYLERLRNRETSLDYDSNLRHLLAEAGDDPVMWAVQDSFFDRVYWNPSLNSAAGIGAETALGTGVVYDSRIHGSWGRIRDLTNDTHGDLSTVGEKDWISNYVETRRNWLATHSNTVLHVTVYRMDAFQILINENNWDLALPFYVRGIRIDEAALDPEQRVSAQDIEERLLMLKNPNMRGDDVEEVQKALMDNGFDLVIDGVFGPKTESAVIEFQQQKGLVADGIVGPATRSALGL